MNWKISAGPACCHNERQDVLKNLCLLLQRQRLSWTNHGNARVLREVPLRKTASQTLPAHNFLYARRLLTYVHLQINPSGEEDRYIEDQLTTDRVFISKSQYL